MQNNYGRGWTRNPADQNLNESAFTCYATADEPNAENSHY